MRRRRRRRRRTTTTTTTTTRKRMREIGGIMRDTNRKGVKETGWEFNKINRAYAFLKVI
jgi:hypothetical protein